MFPDRDEEDDIAERTSALERLGSLGPQEQACWTPLAAGASSDIWRVEWPGAVVGVKRGRAKLAVAAKWLAPVERNASEHRGERTAKWNEGLRIAEVLGNGGRLPDPKLLPWGAPAPSGKQT